MQPTQRFWCVSSPCSHANNFTRSAQTLVLLPYHGITPSCPHTSACSTAASTRHHIITHPCTHTPCTPHHAVAARSFHHTLMPSHQRTQHGCLSSASHHHTPMHSHALHATPCRKLLAHSITPSWPSHQRTQHGCLSSASHHHTPMDSHALHATPCRSCSFIPSHPHALTLPHASQLHCRSITSSCTHVLIRPARHTASSSAGSRHHTLTPSRQAYSTQLHHRSITQSRAHVLTPRRSAHIYSITLLLAGRTQHGSIIVASRNHELMRSSVSLSRCFASQAHTLACLPKHLAAHRALGAFVMIAGVGNTRAMRFGMQRCDGTT